jgi:hypothetical protein
MNYHLLNDKISYDDIHEFENVDLYNNPNLHINISNLIDKSITIRWIHKHSSRTNKDISNFIYFFIFMFNLLSSMYLVWYDDFSQPTKKDIGIFVVVGGNIFISLILIMLKSTHNDIEDYILYTNEWNHLIDTIQRINNLYPHDIMYFNERYFDLIRNQKFNNQSLKELKKQFILSDEYMGIIHNKDIIEETISDIQNYNKI